MLKNFAIFLLLLVNMPPIISTTLYTHVGLYPHVHSHTHTRTRTGRDETNKQNKKQLQQQSLIMNK